MSKSLLEYDFVYNDKAGFSDQLSYILFWD